MYRVPDVDDVVAVAKALGIHLGPEEAVLYRKHLLEQLREFDTFVQARVEEPKPPLVSAARPPGYRPKPEEGRHRRDRRASPLPAPRAGQGRPRARDGPRPR